MGVICREDLCWCHVSCVTREWSLRARTRSTAGGGAAAGAAGTNGRRAHTARPPRLVSVPATPAAEGRAARPGRIARCHRLGDTETPPSNVTMTTTRACTAPHVRWLHYATSQYLYFMTYFVFLSLTYFMILRHEHICPRWFYFTFFFVCKHKYICDTVNRYTQSQIQPIT